MSRQLKTASIPLLCSLCPKNPQFSDISHLLTHVSSKGHLSYRFKLQIRCQGEPEARRQLATFDAWYADNGLEELLAERLATKEQKNTAKRTRGSLKAPTKDKRKEKENFRYQVDESKSQVDGYDQLISTPAYKAPVPRMHMWSTAPPLMNTPLNSASSSRWEQDDIYATPTMSRSIPNFTQDDSPAADVPLQISSSPLKTNELQDEVEGDNSKLKGVYWPGMNLFDSATTEMKRMRNQRKDGSILAQMKSTSREVEPNEIIYNTEGEFQRIRDIYDSSPENSPVRSQKAPSPKKRRARKRKTPLRNISVNIPVVRNVAKSGRPRRPAAAKRQAATVDVIPPTQQKLSKENLLELRNNLFTVSTDEDEEFRLTVEDMRKKGKLSIFKDEGEHSPGRTESPLEDHRFDFGHGLPLENTTSNRIVHASPRAIQRPVPIRLGGKENMQPDYLNGRQTAAGNAYPPHAFHNHTTNPLIFHSYAYSFGLGESPAFHGDFKPAQPNFIGDFKPVMMPSPFRESSNSRGHPNEFVNNGFTYFM